MNIYFHNKKARNTFLKVHRAVRLFMLFICNLNNVQ
nr:MAG TPA: hypothetical protein [Caudoviricetes sp.]